MDEKIYKDLQIVARGLDMPRMLLEGRRNKICTLKNRYLQYTWVNEFFTEFTGLTIEDVRGKTFIEAFIDTNPGLWTAGKDDIYCCYEQRPIERLIQMTGKETTRWYWLQKIPCYPLDHTLPIQGVYTEATDVSIFMQMQTHDEMRDMMRRLTPRQLEFLFRDADPTVMKKELAAAMGIEEKSITGKRREVREVLGLGTAEYELFIEKLRKIL